MSYALQHAIPDLIIHRPERHAPVHRLAFRLITLAFWSLYIYLWLPAITLGAWWLAAVIGIDELGLGPTGDFDTWLLGTLAVSAAVSFVLMVGWAEYNRKHYGHRARRGFQPAITPESTSAAFGVDAAIARKLRAARHATLRLDTRAVAIDVQVHDAR